MCIYSLMSVHIEECSNRLATFDVPKHSWTVWNVTVAPSGRDGASLLDYNGLLILVSCLLLPLCVQFRKSLSFPFDLHSYLHFLAPCDAAYFYCWFLLFTSCSLSPISKPFAVPQLLSIFHFALL